MCETNKHLNHNRLISASNYAYISYMWLYNMLRVSKLNHFHERYYVLFCFVNYNERMFQWTLVKLITVEVIFGRVRGAKDEAKNRKKIKGQNVRNLYIRNVFVYFSSRAVPESSLVIPVTDCKRHPRDVWLVMPDRTPPL